MNKRIKKKWSRIEKLENTVAQLTAENTLLMDAIRRHTALIKELNSNDSRIAQATNIRFDYLERKVADKVSKKSWFGRK